ncbi:hypothetical protein PVK06_036501 [Gossypium arboreum]|uniref:Uncharacterized protein n=1 Tax=Gossypium arboreum TaxID=29729 RepID=A0ABR0NMU9_GOSAR|nr:hypothetical protein PVK06_036501 [Gossypium arboreum]
MPKLEKILLIFSFNILLLPVGTVIRLLTQEGIVGCLGNLYKSIEKLGVAYILSTTNKYTLLKPTYSSSLLANVPLLFPNIESSTTLGIYRWSYGLFALLALGP